MAVYYKAIKYREAECVFVVSIELLYVVQEMQKKLKLNEMSSTISSYAYYLYILYTNNCCSLGIQTMLPQLC